MVDLVESSKQSIRSAGEALRSALGSNEGWEYILPIIFLKALAEVSQKSEERLAFHNLLSDAHGPDLGKKINTTLYTIGKKYSKSLENVFDGFDYRSSRLGSEDSRDYLLKNLLNHLSNFEFGLNSRPSHNRFVCAYAFSSAIQELGRRKLGAEFITPPDLGALIANLVDPKADESLYDPTLGVGALLLECLRYVSETRKGLPNVAGQEKNWFAWSAAKMTLFLLGENSSSICLGDTLRSPKLVDDTHKLRRFDVVISNYPWGIRDWGVDEAAYDLYNRFSLGMPPKSNGDYAFLLHILASLKKTGRAAVVVSNGALSRGGTEREIRRKIVENNWVDAVVGLPPKIFYNKDSACSLLILKKDKYDDTILFINASMYFHQVKDKNIINPEAIKEISSLYHCREAKDSISVLVTLEMLRKQEYDLHVGVHVHSEQTIESVDLMLIEKKRSALEAELKVVEAKLTKLLKKFND
nr:N-6 DNA methylase [Massilia sp. IC2-476]